MRNSESGTRGRGSRNPRLQEFESENLLRQAVAGLLARMPNVSEVQILHGSQEYGKDIVFCSTGPMQETTNCACVIKNKPLSGKLGTTGSLRALIDQIEQSLDTPFPDNRGERRSIHTVYVISPYQVTPAAMEGIEGKLKSRSGQVKFVTGTELYRYFHRFWPAFLEAESTALAQFAQDLEEATGATTSLSYVGLNYHLGAVEKGVGQIYVPASFEREILLYSLPENCERILRHEDLGQHWDNVLVNRFQADLDRLLELIRHLHTWPFPGLRQEPNLEKIISAHEELRERLLGAVKSATDAARARIEEARRKQAQRGGIPDILVDRRTILSGKHVSELTVLASTAFGRANSCLGQVRKELSEMTRRLGSIRAHDENLLFKRDFLHFIKVDDCLRALPCELLRIAGEKRFRMGKSIHRRQDRSLLVVGSPGTGKTTFCTRNALFDVEANASGADPRIPVYVPLHRLGKSSVAATTFREMLLSIAGKSALLLTGSSDWEKRPLRVYLDGLDEIGNRTVLTRVLELARHSESEGADCQIIMTARDYLYDSMLTWMPRVSLGGLSDKEIASLALQWLDNDTDATQDFIKQLRSLPSVAAIVRIPLLATATILVYKRTRRIPANRARLYLAFTNMMCGGWDLAKGIVHRSRFDINSKMHVLSSLAAELHSAKLRQFHEARFARVSERVLSRRSPAVAQDLLDEVLRDGLVTRTGTELHFSHLTFQEFLTAKETVGDPDSLQMQKVLTRYMQGDDWWREVLSFAVGLSENPERLALWFTKRLPQAGRNPRGDIVYQMFEEAFPDFEREEFFRRSGLPQRFGTTARRSPPR